MESRPNDSGQIEAGWALFRHKIPTIFFIIAATALTLLSMIKKFSLIPMLGLISCLYLMAQLGITNWSRFAVWLIVGLAIYFVYSRKASKLAARGR
jgi:Mn2+/Fe2+ NRAMP family transporter